MKRADITAKTTMEDLPKVVIPTTVYKDIVMEDGWAEDELFAQSILEHASEVLVLQIRTGCLSVPSCHEVIRGCTGLVFSNEGDVVCVELEGSPRLANSFLRYYKFLDFPFDSPLEYSFDSTGSKLTPVTPKNLQADASEVMKLVTKYAPANPEVTATGKKAHINEYVDLAGLTATLSPAAISVLRADIAQCGVEINESGTNTQDFERVQAEFQTRAQFAMPEALIQLLKSVPPVLLPNGYDLLSVDGVLDEYTHWLNTYTDWTLEELLDGYDTDAEKTVAIYYSPYWVPFATDGGGNNLSLDYSPGPQGVSGQVIAHGRDETVSKVLADSLEMFISKVPYNKDYFDQMAADRAEEGG